MAKLWRRIMSEEQFLTEGRIDAPSLTSSNHCWSTNWKRIALVTLFILVLVVFHSDLLLNKKIRCTWGSKEVLNEIITEEVVASLKKSFKKVTSELETLKSRHDDLIDKVRRSPRFVNDSNTLLLQLSPGLLINGSIEGYEALRRKICSNIRELGHYINSKLLLAMFEDLKPEEKREFLQEVGERKRSLLYDQQKLPEVDGFADWRRKETRSVSDLIQRRLSHLQNPPNCPRNRKLVCLMDACGFGCQVHHLVYCLIFAYATERTFLIRSYGWNYNRKGWYEFYHQVSNNCTSTYDDRVWQSLVKIDAKVVWLRPLRIAEQSSAFPKFRPYHIPNDLAKRISRFNGDPLSWWIGQMLKYILKPRKHVQDLINRTIANLDFRAPVVGIHVRRTDKRVEAGYFDIDEYMRHVGEYYAQLELTHTLPCRSVYLATDDPRVLTEAIEKYPQYTFYYNYSTSLSANTSSRFSPRALTSLLVDLYMLVRCDYVVCTFSSNMCRLVYEMMQINRDASDSMFSLDHIYYFTKSDPHLRVAVMRNQHNESDNPDSVDFEVGDLIKVNGWLILPYSDDGTVLRTKNTGYIPWYKTVKQYKLYPFPEYPEVPIYTAKFNNRTL